MPTPSQPSPLSRLALLRRIPFWAQTLALCALFAVAGVAVLDDYGMQTDTVVQRIIAIHNAEYIATGSADGLYKVDYRYFGVVFEMPLLLIERAFGLQDSRHIYLTRHLLTHMLFIAGGFACAMLAYRMLGSRWIALFAMLLFLLHPRLYAHSFFNTKDIPFAATLLITLYLAHRAFRKDTLGAFLLCGIGVGLAINQRPFGLMLPPMLLAMRAPDLWQASGWAERKRILLTGAALAIAAFVTVYITHPHYWENPLRFIESVGVMSQHPIMLRVPNLFMGETYMSDAVPWNYVPVWFAITAPPVALLLGAIGVVAVCWQAITRPLAALRDRDLRFRILLLGCFIAPILAVIALQSNIYNGWRHMYFLWAPFCLLAAVGLRAITNIRMGGGIWKVMARLPDWVRGGALAWALAYGVAGVGMLTTLTAIAALHPHQQVYFNALVDTKTPGALAKRYDMDYWQIAQRQSLGYLLARYPDASPRVWLLNSNPRILPQNDRARIPVVSPYAADFYLWIPERRYSPYIPNPQEAGFYHPLIQPWNITDLTPIHSVKAYDNPIALIYGKDAAAYHAAYADIAANGDPLARADFDIYAYHDALYYLSSDCPPPAPSRPDLRIFLHFFPADLADLPAAARERGFETRDFWLNAHAAFFDGKCVNRQLLPDYPIARIDTGVYLAGELIWRADINLAARAAARAVHADILAGDYGAPVAQSRFDLYLRDNALTYLKAPCAEGDADARFFLHIFPANAADLPTNRREFGFVNNGFSLEKSAAFLDGKCIHTQTLPDYSIARIRTGQIAAASRVEEWRADINLAAQALYDDIAAGAYGKPVAQSDFHVYLRDNRLAYLKEPCAPADARARFILHITPANPADLPADRRARGFANLDFKFTAHGARIDDICVASLDLPAYPIALIRTGQNATAPGGNGWREDIDLAARRAAQAAYDGITAGDYGAPVAQSRFALYLRDNTLTYLKAPCAPDDTRARFFLHITPADPAHLPAAARERGFANHDFHFPDHGLRAADICLATLDLPDYPIHRIRTGQFVSGESAIWRAEFAAGQ